MPQATDRPAPAPRMLDFRSGGWVLLLAFLLVCGLVGWQLIGLAVKGRSHPHGDGIHPDTYGFDLSTCLVPREAIVGAGFAKDGLLALTNPATITRDQAEQPPPHRHGKLLVSRDRVIGVAFNGQSRAYPLELMAWHQIVNDTVGGREIAVTYDPLCNSAVVFDRHIDPAPSAPASAPASTSSGVREFGISGLLMNSNLILYDRRTDPHQESLWSQLQFRAIAGPAAQRAARLSVLPCDVTLWRDWKARHPETTVLAPVETMLRLYTRTYQSYSATDTLRFPVDPLPPVGRPLKSDLIALENAGRWHSVFLSDLAARLGPDGAWTTEIAGQPVRLHYTPDPPTARAEAADGSPLPTAYSYWFAWYAMHNDRGDQ